MRDFHRRKLNLRKTLAVELLQRGVAPEEVARLCRPTSEEIRALKQEIQRETEDRDSGVIDAEFWDVVQEDTPPTPVFMEPVIMFMVFVLLLAFSLGFFLGL